MSKTLLLLFHPNFDGSRANRSLVNHAKTVDGLEVINMQELYPDNQIDLKIEINRILQADRIIIQFPLQWYSVPSLLRVWQNKVLTNMFYLKYESQGKYLEGTPLLVTTTAGNVSKAYSPEGINLFSIEEILNPLRAMANRCSLPWADPFYLFESNSAKDTVLDEHGAAYAKYIKSWIESSSLKSDNLLVANN